MLVILIEHPMGAIADEPPYRTELNKGRTKAPVIRAIVLAILMSRMTLRDSLGNSRESPSENVYFANSESVHAVRGPPVYQSLSNEIHLIITLIMASAPTKNTGKNSPLPAITCNGEVAPLWMANANHWKQRERESNESRMAEEREKNGQLLRVWIFELYKLCSNQRY